MKLGLARTASGANATDAFAPRDGPPPRAPRCEPLPASGVDLLLRPPQAAAPKGRLLGSTSALLPKALPLVGPTRARPPPRRFG